MKDGHCPADSVDSFFGWGFWLVLWATSSVLALLQRAGDVIDFESATSDSPRAMSLKRDDMRKPSGAVLAIQVSATLRVTEEGTPEQPPSDSRLRTELHVEVAGRAGLTSSPGIGVLSLINPFHVSVMSLSFCQNLLP